MFNFPAITRIPEKSIVIFNSRYGETIGYVTGSFMHHEEFHYTVITDALCTACSDADIVKLVKVNGHISERFASNLYGKTDEYGTFHPAK